MSSLSCKSSQSKTLRCPVFHIKAPIPANSYIVIPKNINHSLGLTGRYFYLLFRPHPGKYFVVHLDVCSKVRFWLSVPDNFFRMKLPLSRWISTLTFPSFPLSVPLYQGGPRGAHLFFQYVQRVQVESYLAPVSLPMWCWRWFCLCECSQKWKTG